MLNKLKNYFQNPDTDQTHLKKKEPEPHALSGTTTFSGKSLDTEAKCNNQRMTKRSAVEFVSPRISQKFSENSNPPNYQILLPLEVREIFRMKSSWIIVKDKMKEAGVELFLLYVKYFHI